MAGFCMSYPWDAVVEQSWVSFVLSPGYGFLSALAAHLWIRELARVQDPLVLEDSRGQLWEFYRGSYCGFVTVPVQLGRGSGCH